MSDTEVRTAGNELARQLGVYRFPATRWATDNTILEQTRKVIDEAHEAHYEVLHSEDPRDVAEELLDTIQAAETGLRILEAGGVDIDAMRAQVERKNQARGYYPQGTE